MSVQLELSKSKPDFMQFDIRLLTGDESDTAAYRALRDKIRSGDGVRNFADLYEREDKLNEQLWREWCAAKREHCIVGTFDTKKENELVSVMMITAQGPADSLVAEWEATWVEPGYRGSGVARRAYEAVQRQTREYGYQHAVVYIRDDNHHSREIREGQGFTYLATHDVEWADGTTGPSNLFILDLFPDCPADENPHGRAVSRLEVTLESMKGEVPFMEEAIQLRIAALRREKTQAMQTSSRRPRIFVPE